MANKSGNGKMIGSIGVLAAIISVVCTSVLQRMSQIERSQTLAAALWRENAKGYDAWIGEHDRRIEARDASQWERIWALERFAFGKATPMTVAPGEQP